MFGPLPAPFAIFEQFYFALNFLLVFARIVIDSLAGFAAELNKILGEF